MKLSKPYIYVFLPMFLLYIIFAAYSPGAARTRDSVFPLLVLLASIRFYDMKNGIINLIVVLIKKVSH